MERNPEPKASNGTSDPANIVAWAGIAFGLVAAILYSVLFFMLSELPSTRNELEELATNAPSLTRFLVVGGSAGLLNVVSLILCLTGFVISRRARFETVAGSILSGLMLLAFLSVVFVSLILVP